MLCLLLPHENRNTMRELLNFFKLVIDLQSFNKMSIHNVATITAPSFFPPRFVHPTDKNDISAQVRMAAQCCHLANVLIAQSDNLWMVPQRLIDEAKKISKTGNVSKSINTRNHHHNNNRHIFSLSLSLSLDFPHSKRLHSHTE
jgi:Rho GTPase-activating protein 18/28/40